MSELVCDIAECTFPQTGTCMKSYEPTDCPSHQAALRRLRGESPDLTEVEAVGTDTSAEEQSTNQIGDAVLAPPDEKPTLPRSGTLGLLEADEIMSSRYVNLIGIVGLPNAGKTACIASLYLLLAHNSLKGFTYSNSKTLMALEEISAGTRRWNNGDPPPQMTSHTELADDRQAGFLHLRLRREADGRKFDFLLPDLPGEWSRSLIANGDAERFKFLNAAEVIWLMANGRDFLDKTTRKLSLYRITNLIERLAPILPIPRPRLIFVASWHDMGEFPADVFVQMQEYGKQFGFEIEFAPIASFSVNETSPGFGLAELIEKSISVPLERNSPWPANELPVSDRAMLNFRVHV